MIVCERLTPMTNPSMVDELDLNLIGTRVVYDVRKYALVSIEAVASGTWSTAKVTIYRSQSGSHDITHGIAGTIGPGNDVLDGIPVPSTAYIAFTVTTVEGSALSASFRVNGFYDTNGGILA